MSRTRTRFSHPRGIRFQCTRCALCCGDTENRTRHILLLREEAEIISKTVSEPVGTFAAEIKGREPYVYEMRKTGGEGKCLFLDGRSCSVYELRPLICRFYPFRLVTMKDGRQEFFPTQECPGMGKGKRLEEEHFESLFERACVQLETKKTGKT